VTQSPTAFENNDPYDKEILVMEISGNTAFVKTKVNVKGLELIDYITLIKKKNEWKIWFKSFSD
jgi:hypothetical protein